MCLFSDTKGKGAYFCELLREQIYISLGIPVNIVGRVPFIFHLFGTEPGVKYIQESFTVQQPFMTALVIKTFPSQVLHGSTRLGLRPN